MASNHGVSWGSSQRREFKGEFFGPFSEIDIRPHRVGMLNTWLGFPVTPILREPAVIPVLILDHMRMMCGNVESHYRYMEQWMASLRQHPAKPMVTSIILCGEEGCGKSMLLEAYCALYGKAFANVSHKNDVLGEFNAIVDGKLLINFEEMFWKEGASGRFDSAFKALVTSPTLRVRRMRQDVVYIRNILNFLGAMNPGSTGHVLPADPNSRRWVIFMCAEALIGNWDYFKKLYGYIWDNGCKGLRLLEEYFLYHVDTDGFGRGEDIPVTEILQDQRARNMCPLRRWIYELLNRGTTLPRSRLEKIGEWAQVDRKEEDAAELECPGWIRELPRALVYGLYKQECVPANRNDGFLPEAAFWQQFKRWLPGTVLEHGGHCVRVLAGCENGGTSTEYALRPWKYCLLPKFKDATREFQDRTGTKLSFDTMSGEEFEEMRCAMRETREPAVTASALPPPAISPSAWRVPDDVLFDDEAAREGVSALHDENAPFLFGESYSSHVMEEVEAAHRHAEAVDEDMQGDVESAQFRRADLQEEPPESQSEEEEELMRRSAPPPTPFIAGEAMETSGEEEEGGRSKPLDVERWTSSDESLFSSSASCSSMSVDSQDAENAGTPRTIGKRFKSWCDEGRLCGQCNAATLHAMSPALYDAPRQACLSRPPHLKRTRKSKAKKGDSKRSKT